MKKSVKKAEGDSAENISVTPETELKDATESVEETQTEDSGENKITLKEEKQLESEGRYHRPDYEPDEMTIKEIMIQKGCNRERAIYILKNPSK